MAATALPTFHDPIAHSPHVTPPTLTIHVVATSDKGTRTALRAAVAYGAGVATRTVLLVPHAVPYQETLERPTSPVAFTAERYEQMAAEIDRGVVLCVCICRPGDLAIERALPREAVVLVGGRRGRWVRSREQRLTRALNRHGHRAVFIAASS